MHKLWLKLFFPVVAGVIIISGSNADDQLPPSTHTLEALVSKWVELKSTIASEKNDWRNDKLRLEDEYRLFEKEKSFLEEKIRSIRAAKAALAEERAGLIKKKETLTNVLKQTEPILDETEINIKKWRKIIPPPLILPLEPLFARLDNSSQLSVSQRIQTIFSLYGEIEELQHEIRITKEILKTESGRQREFDVVYIGLARGFCVSEDGGEAAVGKPTRNGWKWEWSKGLASSIRQAIEYYNREKTAGFIELPIEINSTDIL